MVEILARLRRTIPFWAIAEIGADLPEVGRRYTGTTVTAVCGVVSQGRLVRQRNVPELSFETMP